MIRNRKNLPAFLLTIAALSLLGFVLFSCKSAPQFVPAPSAGPTQTNITATQTNLSTAKQQNDRIRQISQQVHDKDVILDRWDAAHQ